MQVRLLATAAVLALSMLACAPPASPPAEPTPPVETVEEAAVPNIPANCAALGHRAWAASLATSGSGRTLTVSGEVDLPTAGFSVSLARQDASRARATLSLVLAAPSGPAAQVVTAVPVRYFAPADAAYTLVQIRCGDGVLAEIPVQATP